MVTRLHKNIKLAFGSCSEEQRQHQKLDIRFNSPAVTVPRAGTNFTLFPVLSSSNWINGRNSVRKRAEFLIPQGLYHYSTDKKTQPKQSWSGGGRVRAREISHGWFYSYFKAFSQESGCQPGCRSNQYNQGQTQNWEKKTYYYLPVLLFSLYIMGVGCHMEADRASVFRTGSTTY